MSSPTTIDLSALLAPISESSPAGSDPRNAAPAKANELNDYSKLKGAYDDARREEKEKQKNPDAEVEPTAKWRLLRTLAEKILAQDAKDVEVACCLFEAWIRLEGFAGLHAGLELLRQLVTQYWDSLFPLLVEGQGFSDRVDPIDRLNGRAGPVLVSLPITGNTSLGQLDTNYYVDAVNTGEAKSDREREARMHRGTPSLEIMQQAVAETDVTLFQSIVRDLGGAQQALEALTELLIDHCGVSESPSTSAIAETIEKIKTAVLAVAGERLAAAEPASGTTTGEAGSPGGGPAQGGVAVSGPIRSRQDAFRALQQVAEFFEQMDPQSLLAAHVRRILKLGKMSPAEYFVEILEDETARRSLFKLVGLAEPNPSE